MSLETAQFIKNLVATNPEGTDPKSQGDDHLRLIKAVLQSQFSGLNQGKPITVNEDHINASLIPGSFGLGYYGYIFNDANAIADQSGFYWLSGTPILNCPPGAIAGDTLLHISATNVVKTQLYIRANTGELWTRGMYGAGSWSSWNKYVIGTKQTSIVDTTPLALMINGAFGLGYNLTNMPAYNIDTPPNYTCFIGIREGTQGILPPGGASTPGVGDVMLNICYNTQVYYQLYFSFSGPAPGVWARLVVNGAASAWGSLVSVGTFQNWLNVTGSRALNNVYTNDLGRPIEVSVGATTNATSGSFGLWTGGNVAISVASWGSISGNLPLTCSGVIPPGGTYKVTGNGTLVHWSELR